MKLVHRWQGRKRRRDTRHFKDEPIGRSVWEWCEAPKVCTVHTAHRGRLVPGHPEVP